LSTQDLLFVEQSIVKAETAQVLPRYSNTSPLRLNRFPTTTMADEEVATKAPESDAVEDSLFKGDSIAQEGPSMGVSTFSSLE
jgi:hypothetical protein